MTRGEDAGFLRQAVILVGGRGTRLGALTREEPKPLLPVGGRPFIAWILDRLKARRVERVLLLAGFRADRVREVARELGGELEVVEEAEPLGTGGALRHALDRLDERFLLLNGDSLFDIDLGELAAESGGPDDAGAVALLPLPDASRYGVAVVQGYRIVRFEERPSTPGPGLINGGVAVLRRSAIAEAPLGRPISLERELYPSWAGQGRLRGKVFDAPFIDMGTPADFERAQRYVPALFSLPPNRAG